MGASGPLGREVTAPWLDYDGVVADREAFRALMERIACEAEGDPVTIQAERDRLDPGWFDVHATTRAALQA